MKRASPYDVDPTMQSQNVVVGTSLVEEQRQGSCVRFMGWLLVFASALAVSSAVGAVVILTT